MLRVLHIIGNYLELRIIIGASNVIKKSEESFRGRGITTNYMKMEIQVSAGQKFCGIIRILFRDRKKFNR